MSDGPTAKLFQHGRSQAVRLPKEFRLPGKEVRVRRIGRSVLLEPMDEGFDMARVVGEARLLRRRAIHAARSRAAADAG